MIFAGANFTYLFGGVAGRNRDNCAGQESILKSAHIIPEEMELLRQIEGLKKSLDFSTTEMERKALRQQLAEKLTNLNVRLEQNRKKHLTKRSS
jgi:hypothetical protein